MFRRTVLPLTNSDIVKLGLKGRLESPSVNEDASIYIEGQMDSGFIGELTIGTQTYKGFLVKVDPNPVPPSVPRDTVTSLISPNSPIRDLGLGKGIPGYETLSYPPSLLSSAAFHPAPNFIPSPNMVPPPPPPSIPMDTEKKDKKRKKKDSKKDSDDEPKKKDKKKKKKKKTENNNGNVTSSKSTEKSNKEKSTSKKDEKDKNSTSNSTNKKSTTSNSSGGTVINVQNMMNRGGVPQPPSTNNNNSGWARDTSLSTKCMNCSQILLYPAGEKTVRCPSCKAILDVEHAESSVLRPCVGCSTMLGNPTNALKVLCPLCKTTMDWSKPPPSVQQMQAAADVKAQLKEKLASKSDAPVINLEEEKATEKDTATSTTTSTSDSNSAPVAKENEEMAEADNEKANEDEKSNDESANDKETTNDKEESKATTTESNGKEPEKEVEAEKS